MDPSQIASSQLKDPDAPSPHPSDDGTPPSSPPNPWNDDNPPSPYLPILSYTSPKDPPPPTMEYAMPASVVFTVNFHIGQELVPALREVAMNADPIGYITLPLSAQMAVELAEVHWRACLPSNIVLSAEWIELREWCLGAFAADSDHTDPGRNSVRAAIRKLCHHSAQLTERQQTSAQNTQRSLEDIQQRMRQAEETLSSHAGLHQVAQENDQQRMQQAQNTLLYQSNVNGTVREHSQELVRYKTLLENTIGELSRLKESHEQLQQQVTDMNMYFTRLNGLEVKVARISLRNQQRDVIHLKIADVEFPPPLPISISGVGPGNEPPVPYSSDAIVNMSTREIIQRLHDLDFSYLPVLEKARGCWELSVPMECAYRNILIELMGMDIEKLRITPEVFTKEVFTAAMEKKRSVPPQILAALLDARRRQQQLAAARYAQTGARASHQMPPPHQTEDQQ